MEKEIQDIAKEVEHIQEGRTDMLDGNETVSDRLIILCYKLLNIISNMEGIK